MYVIIRDVAYKDPNDPRSAESKHRHYLKNKSKYVEQARRQKAELKRFVQNLKEQCPCADCDQYYPFYVMQYDHIGTDKVNSVSKLINVGGRKQVLEEIAKCELVCANCHASRTYKRISNSAG